MIFLDYRFTIPNFPSRLLSYMQAKLPVLTVTDPNTDIGDIAEENGFGVKCISEKPDDFVNAVKRLSSMNMPEMGERAFDYMQQNYTVDKSYEIIMK